MVALQSVIASPLFAYALLVAREASIASLKATTKSVPHPR